jgi:hypothetical protein
MAKKIIIPGGIEGNINTILKLQAQHLESLLITVFLKHSNETWMIAGIIW